MKAATHVNAVAVDLKLRWIATSRLDGPVLIVSLEDGGLRKIKRGGMTLTASRDGRWLFDVSWNGDLLVHDPLQARTVNTLSLGADWMGIDTTLCRTRVSSCGQGRHRRLRAASRNRTGRRVIVSEGHVETPGRHIARLLDLPSVGLPG